MLAYILFRVGDNILFYLEGFKFDKRYNILKFDCDKSNIADYLKVVMNNNNIHYNFLYDNWIINKDYINEFSKLYEVKPYISNDVADMGINMKLQPYQYQKEFIKFGLDKKNALFIAPCGSGKTAIGLGLCCELYKRKLITHKCLIVVKASLKYQWFKEVEKFCDLRGKVIETSKKAKKKFDEQFENCDIYIANYETLKDDKVVEKLLAKKVEFAYLDEIQSINNHTSDRSKALYKINSIKYKIGATATPITNNPGNLFGIFNFIDEDLFVNWSRFSKSYLRYAGHKRPPMPVNQEQLRKEISPYLLVKNKYEIASQLPKILVNKVYCDMNTKMFDMNSNIMLELDSLQKKANDIEKKLTPEQCEGDDNLVKIKSRIMMLQTFAQELVNSPKLLLASTSQASKQFYVDEESSKIEQCMELVDSIIDSGEKVCIFSKFERMQPILEEVINKRFKNIKVAKVDGSLDAKARYEEVYTKFRDDDSYKILLGTDAMAEGVNLNKCRYLIEYELANSFAIQTQRHGRLERADSIHSTVIVYQLIMNSSWDEIQLKIIEKKENYDNMFFR